MQRQRIYEETTRHFLAPIDPYLRDKDVTEIMINGPRDIYIEKNGRIEKTDSSFASLEALMAAVNNIAEYVDRPLNEDNPALDGRLPDQNRIHILMPPISQFICLTIRKHRESLFTLDELVEQGSLEPEARDLLIQAIDDHANIVIAGATGAGKTVLLQACSLVIGHDERILVIEDSTELRLSQPHTISLQAIPTSTMDRSAVLQRELLAHALRMRPDRIIVGEVRRGEALDMIQAMLCGHGGSLSTIHAGSPETAATRLETLCLQSDTQLPIYVARTQVATAVNLFVQVVRRNSKRYVSQISELVGLDSNQEYVWKHRYPRERRGC